MSRVDEQDWTPVGWDKKKDAVKKESVVRPSVNPQGSGQLTKNVREEFDPSKIEAPLKSDLTLGQAIQKARTALGFTQDKLNKDCMFPANTVKTYENGSAVVSPEQINKMEKVLRVKLPRPKKQKKNVDE